MMLSNLGLLVLFLFFCSDLFGQSTVSGSFDFDGRTRDYAIYEPANFNDSQAVPLLLVLHHNGATGPGVMDYMGFKPVADTANFLSVYPTALEDQFASAHAWNSGLNPLNQIDDVGFLSALIDTMMAHYNIDANRVYATGHSMGGYMCYRLACELSGRIAAIAPSAGTLALPIRLTCNPSRPVPVLHKHGSNDGRVKWDGSEPPFSSSVDATIDYWVQHNHCPTNPVITQLPNLVNDGIVFETHYYGPCDKGSEVILYKGVGAPHGWQAFGHDIITPVVVWNFLKKYSLQGLIPKDTVTGMATVNQEQLNTYPNPFTYQLNVELKKEERGWLKIFDAKGSLVTELKNTGNQNRVIIIKTSSWAKGVYLLQLFSDDSIQSSVLLKQ